MSEQASNTFPPEKAQAKGQAKEEEVPGSQDKGKTSSRLSAGDISLDFVNTRNPDNFLTNTTDFLHWCRDVRLITREKAQILLTEAESHPQASAALFIRLLELRETSYRVLLALLHQLTPAPSDVQILQSIFIEIRAHEQLIPVQQHLKWQWETKEDGLTLLYWSLSRSLENVLTTPLIERMKECPPSRGGCGWLFIDKSKNSSRQWCSDDTCGSRIRMRRLYARRRGKSEE